MSSGAVIKIVVLGSILASDVYFVKAGLVRPSLVVAQVMMILSVWILRVAKEREL